MILHTIKGQVKWLVGIHVVYAYSSISKVKTHGTIYGPKTITFKSIDSRNNIKSSKPVSWTQDEIYGPSTLLEDLLFFENAFTSNGWICIDVMNPKPNFNGQFEIALIHKLGEDFAMYNSK